MDVRTPPREGARGRACRFPRFIMIRLTQADHDRLFALAARRDRPVSYVARELIGRGLASEEQEARS